MQFRVGILLAMLLASQVSIGQGVSQSPYAQFGYGELESLANARFQGMGNAGLSVVSSYNINLKNPAAAAFNRFNVIFEGGFYGQNSKYISQSNSQTILSGNVNYFALLIPISTKNWTIIAGIAPFANANTKFSYQVAVNSKDTLVRSSSILSNLTYDGGLNQVFLTNAIKLPKGFSIGLTTSLVFGTINRKTEQALSLTKYKPGYLVNPAYNSNLDTVPYMNDIPYTKTVINSQEVYRFIDFKLGIGYNKLIKTKYALGLAATGTFNQCITADRKLINTINSNNITTGYNGYVLYTDTASETSIQAKLPSVYSFGASFEKLNAWTFAADYTFTDYGNYKSFDQLKVFNAGGHKVSIGTEFTPDYAADPNKFGGYLKRIVYRLGGYYAITPYALKGAQIDDLGATFGMGLPVGKGGSGIINLSFAAGKRGTTDNGLIQENYFRFFVGVNIVDRWFVRYKVD